MKKLMTLVMTAFLFFLLMPTQLKAEGEPAVVAADATVTVTAEMVKAEALIARINEIYLMDATEMTSAEKKVLRKEVRTIKSELNEISELPAGTTAVLPPPSSGGIYLSVGAAILIVLLLILLL
jgi:hypothetical protein